MMSQMGQHAIAALISQLDDFEELVQQLSPRAPGLKSLSLGCNPFSDHRELSFHSALLSVGHVHSAQLRDLYAELERVFSSACQEGDPARAGGDECTDVASTVESACKVYAQGKDYRRLMVVAMALFKLKMNFPLLEQIDEHKLLFYR